MIALDQAGYERISQYVSRRTGLALPDNRRSFIEAAIARAATKTQAAAADDYLNLLTASDQLLDDLIVQLTIGETYFFRDPSHFHFIRQEILPEIRRRLGPGHMLQLWSAGCASGEEPYSLAILLEEERIGPARIFATDISRAALAKAHDGLYSEWSLRTPWPGLVDRYFRRTGNRFVLADRIRRAVLFRPLNLAADLYPGFVAAPTGMDVILCRNVLIYMESERIPAVAQQLFASLAEGGWLITGPSDPLLSSHAPFEVAVTPRGVFYRRNGSSGPFPARTVPAANPVPPPPAKPEPAASPASFPPPQQPDLLALGRKAFAGGNYAEALRHLTEAEPEFEATELKVLALANLGLAMDAERLASAAAASVPLAAERHLLHAMTLLSLGRHEDAMSAARRAVYLKPDYPLAYLALGTCLLRVGADASARRAFETGRGLAAGQTPKAVLDGEAPSHGMTVEAVGRAMFDDRPAGVR